MPRFRQGTFLWLCKQRNKVTLENAAPVGIEQQVEFTVGRWLVFGNNGGVDAQCVELTLRDAMLIERPGIPTNGRCDQRHSNADTSQYQTVPKRADMGPGLRESDEAVE